MIGLPSISLPISYGAVASDDLLERTMRLEFEMTGVSVGNAVSAQGLFPCHWIVLTTITDASVD